MNTMRSFVLGFALLAAPLFLGCKHKCQEDNATIPKEIEELGILMEGADACSFGGKRSDEFMVNLAYIKVYHKGNFKRVGLDYMDHAEKKGWERVECAGGLGPTTMSDYQLVECFKKDDKRVRFEFYDFDGTAVDVDLLRLKTKEEVLKGK